jgi:hypothetical protein
MEATITLHDEDFTLEFFHRLKAFVEGKEVVISVREEDVSNSNIMREDDTEYLMRSPENHQQLLDAINRIDNKSGLIAVVTEDLL